MNASAAAVLSLFLSLAACNIGPLGDPPTYQSKSPGMVTLRLDLPSTRSFCDQLPNCAFSVDHIGITNVMGQPIQLGAGICATLCASGCTPLGCPLICPSGGGQAVTQVELSWDGAFYQPGTCGSAGYSCVSRHFVLPGRYNAHMCATPGTLTAGDGGPPTCTATGPQECDDVQFEIPGPPLVERALPDAP